MKVSTRVLLYSIIISLVLPFNIPREKALAATTCKGITPLTDPLAKRMEKGETVIWTKVNPNLLSAKAKYEQLLKAKGWKIRYNSAYRPYQYQKHLYQIATGPSSQCKNAEKKKHRLSALVSKPDQNAPHTKGIAFDATVYNQKGKPLNGLHFTSSSLIKVAKQAGLKFISTSRDGVHHQLINPNAKQPPAPVETPYLAKGKITSVSGLNVRSLPNSSAPRKGVLSMNDSVEIVAKQGDWYKIKNGTGYGWIMGGNGNLQKLPLSPIISSLKVTYYVSLYFQPSFSSKNLGAIAPQTVKVMKINGNGWYQISSSVGAAWIFINPNPVKSLQVNKTVTLYSKPATTSKINGRVAPQKVKVRVDRGDGWYQISSSLGAKWINYKR